MSSSTSSFDRADGCLTAGQLVSALALFAVLLLVIEGLWRYAGATPEYVDSLERWAYARAAAPIGSPIILAGDSRMQFAIDVEVIEARYPGANVRQLAVAGRQPFATIQDLAVSSDFRGVVITSLMPFDIMKPFREDQQLYVEYYESKWTFNNRLNFLADNVLESVLISRQQKYGLNSMLHTVLRTSKLPAAVQYLHTHFNREVDANYRLANLEFQVPARIEQARARYNWLYPIDKAQWLASLRELDALAGGIVARGGCVVAVRMPSANELYAEEVRLFPKTEFWDRIAASRSIIAVHFLDIPGVGDFRLPDLAHVDEQDKAAFTTALFDTIESVAEGRCERLDPVSRPDRAWSVRSANPAIHASSPGG